VPPINAFVRIARRVSIYNMTLQPDIRFEVRADAQITAFQSPLINQNFDFEFA
jgi:hypothetical protein